MNNLGLSLKKFFTNKNTVTIIGVVAILVILYFMYTKQIQKATKEISVPVAKNTIEPQKLIQKEDVDTIKIAQAAKPKDVYLSENAVIGKYTGVGVTVPKGSMFYTGFIVEQDQLPGSWLKLLQPQGTDTLELQRPYSFPVNVATTFGNSIQPGDYVDFYLKTYDADKTVIFGRIFNNVKVLSVTDSSGKDVFRSQSSIGQPAYLNFGMNDDMYRIFKLVEYASGDLSLIVVPRGGSPLTDAEEESLPKRRIAAAEARALVEEKGGKDDGSKGQKIWKQGYETPAAANDANNQTEDNTNQN